MTDSDRSQAGESDAFADAFDGPKGDTPDGFVHEVPPADADASDPDAFAEAFNGPTDTPPGSYIHEVPPDGPEGTDPARSDDGDSPDPGGSRGG